jgi:general secretion pathway protein M
MNALPTGRRGQALALAITVIRIAALWLGAVAPPLDWYAGRSEHLAQQRTLAARMAAVAASGPALQRQVAAAESAAPPPRAVFEGGADAVAGAALQQAVQDIAARAGATVLSAEVLPAGQAGAYRRIGMHVLVSASWPVLVAMLSDTLQASPRMLVDDLTLRQSLALGARESHPMEAGLTIIAFHAGSAPR